MILVVCLNPALDISYSVPSVVPGASHRVDEMAERPGGKGINVSRILHQMGEPVQVTGLIGGPRGESLAANLAVSGLSTAFSPIAGHTRRTVAVVDAAGATLFNERGPAVTASEWQRFFGLFRDLLVSADVVAISGSLPAGLDDSVYADLVEVAVASGVPAIVDAAGAPLHAALRARPTIVAPNRSEASEVLHRSLSTVGDIADAAREFMALGAEAAVISNGPDGLVAGFADGAWVARPPSVISGNPTGAGDALTAALARGVRHGDSLPDMLRVCSAWSASAVSVAWAGELDRRVLNEVLPFVEVEDLACH